MVMKTSMFITASLVLVLSNLVLEDARAAPSTTCKGLAKQFAEATGVLDTSDLAKLRTCVSDELNSQLITRRPVAPAPPERPPLGLPAARSASAPI